MIPIKESKYDLNKKRKPIRVKVFNRNKRTTAKILRDHSSLELNLDEITWMIDALIEAETMNK